MLAADLNASRDTVTIALFSTEQINDAGDRDFSKQMFEEVENVKNIVKQLTEQAVRAGNTPPKFVLSVSLVPNWSKGSSYTDPDYQKLQKHYIEQVKKAFCETGVEILDFYNQPQITQEEKAYMNQLQSLGSNLDIMKFRSVFENNDKGCRHLQLDSNTLIKSFDELYNITFGDHNRSDAINASFYDTDYVSAHSKIIYTTPEGKLAEALKKAYMKYMAENKDKPYEKGNRTNNVYAKTYAPALSTVNFTYQNMDLSDKWTFYPATLSKEEFRLTSTVVTSVNMGWGKDRKDAPSINTLAEKKFRCKIGDANCDFESFKYLLKKYTDPILRNSISDQSPEGFLSKLLEISDPKFDLELLATYYEAFVAAYPDLAQDIALLIPNTETGNCLTKILFGCTVDELRDNPTKKSLTIDDEGVKKYCAELIQLNEKFIKDYRYFSKGKAMKFLKQLVNLYSDSEPENDIEKQIYRLFKGKAWDQIPDEKELENTDLLPIYNFFKFLLNEKSEHCKETFDSVTNALERQLLPENEELYNKIMTLSKHLLEKGSEFENHFNYTPRRAENLLEHHKRAKYHSERASMFVHFELKSGKRQHILGSPDLMTAEISGSTPKKGPL